ncbi:helicase [Candidatus Saccharibacteria bacterium]|nr:MAG: helicase [Candidatus Saccharibacteria bacterium]
MLQNEALDILKMGHNVYLTGAAGSGKTFALNQYIKYLRENNITVGVTASTGIAATHMNGMTIHSWAGLGAGDAIDIDSILTRPTLKKRMLETKVLIIDEVSMLDGNILDAVDAITRAFKDKTKPFGGLQVVLSGDLFQLPPVSKSGEPFFIFKSAAWKAMGLKICYLEEQHRQDDSSLLNILNAIRANNVDETHFEELSERMKPAPKDEDIIKLYTHNAHVDDINTEELKKIKGKTTSYIMATHGQKNAVESLIKRCLAPEQLQLKVGAEVMFVANNPTKDFYNGTLGKVLEFNDAGQPVVQTRHKRITVEPHSWKTEDGDKTIAEVEQLPLRLAWAITIHKSQGMSLDAAEVDLSKSFEPGMGYVALSRVRSIEGLYIKGINNMAMVVNELIIDFDAQLKARSAQAVAGLKTISKKSMDQYHQTVRKALQSDEDKLLADYDEAVFEKLKQWRTKQADKQSVPAYVILPDKTLKLIAAILPSDKQALARISGIGTVKLEKYSADILSVIESTQPYK